MCKHPSLRFPIPSGVLQERMGISQAAIADRIGMHRSCYGVVERGKTNLMLQTIERISSNVDVEPATSSVSVRLACSGEVEAAA